ncbi:MAG: HAD family hydrolase [Bacteroidota bacterium]
MLSPNGIRAILFDLDGTLRHNRPEGGEVFMDRAISLGLPVGPEDRLRGMRWEHYYWANSPELKRDLQAHGGANPEFWQNYGRRQLVALGTESKRSEELAPVLSQYMSEQYKPESVLPPEVPAMLAQLRQAGFKLGVVSNRERPFQEELDRFGVTPQFDLLLAAGEVRIYKPDPGIFQAALERIGIQPGAAMYVGDNYFADVMGSRRAGLRSVLYDPRGIYPHANCEVIASFDQLTTLLK